MLSRKKNLLVLSLTALSLPVLASAATPSAERIQREALKPSNMKRGTVSLYGDLLSGNPTRIPYRLPGAEMQVVRRDRLAAQVSGIESKSRGDGSGSPEAMGDVLTIPKNDTLAFALPGGLPSTREHETTLVMVDPTGTNSHLAFRQQTWDFVYNFPVSVTGVTLLLDNVFGRRDFTVRLVHEDPADPLKPGAFASFTRATATIPGSTLPAPDGNPAKPEFEGDMEVDDDWEYFTEDVTPFAVNLDLSVTDRTWNDDFTGFVEWDKGLLPRDLANPGNFWSECGLTITTCKLADEPPGMGDPHALRVNCPDGPACDPGAGDNIVVKELPEAVLGLAGTIHVWIDDNMDTVQDPDELVFAQRPIFDQDYLVQADYDVTAATAREAGVFARAEIQPFITGSAGGIYMYYAAYQKTGNRVVLFQAEPSGAADAPPVLREVASFVLGAAAPTGTLGIAAVGSNPATTVIVYHNGTEVLRHTDSVWRWMDVLGGIGSMDATSTGEEWSNFQIFRNPDLYIVVEAPTGVPAGATVGLGGDLSISSDEWAAVYRLDDDLGLWTLEPRPDPLCAAPNGFAHLRVEDTTAGSGDNVWNKEFTHNEIRIECADCMPTGTTNPCALNQAPTQATIPVFELGKDIQVYGRWWNNHADDILLADNAAEFAAAWTSDYDFTTLFPGTLSGPCSRFAPEVTGFEAGIINFGGDRPGQTSTPGPAFFRWVDGGGNEAPILSFTPSVPGVYCVELQEGYSVNFDQDTCFDLGVCDTDIGCDCFRDSDPEDFFTRNTDHRPFTTGAHRFIQVGDSCVVTTPSTLARNCLKAWKDSDTGNVCLNWTDRTPVDIFTYTLNVRDTKNPATGDAIGDACFDRFPLINDLRDDADGCRPELMPAPTCDPTTSLCMRAFTLFQDEGCGSGVRDECPSVVGEAGTVLLADTGTLDCP